MNLIKRKNGTRNAIKVILCQNMCPTFNYVTEREVAIIPFVFSYALLTLQMKNSTRSISTINPVATENMDDYPTQPQGSRIALPQINTLHCQRKELKHKGGQRQFHDACIVCTAVGKKAHLRTKQHLTVKKSSL